MDWGGAHGAVLIENVWWFECGFLLLRLWKLYWSSDTTRGPLQLFYSRHQSSSIKPLLPKSLQMIPESSNVNGTIDNSNLMDIDIVIFSKKSEPESMHLGAIQEEDCTRTSIFRHTWFWFATHGRVERYERSTTYHQWRWSLYCTDSFLKRLSRRPGCRASTGLHIECRYEIRNKLGRRVEESSFSTFTYLIKGIISRKKSVSSPRTRTAAVASQWNNSTRIDTRIPRKNLDKEAIFMQQAHWGWQQRLYWGVWRSSELG